MIHRVGRRALCGGVAALGVAASVLTIGSSAGSAAPARSGTWHPTLSGYYTVHWKGTANYPADPDEGQPADTLTASETYEVHLHDLPSPGRYTGRDGNGGLAFQSYDDPRRYVSVTHVAISETSSAGCEVDPQVSVPAGSTAKIPKPEDGIGLGGTEVVEVDPHSVYITTNQFVVPETEQSPASDAQGNPTCDTGTYPLWSSVDYPDSVTSSKHEREAQVGDWRARGGGEGWSAVGYEMGFGPPSVQCQQQAPFKWTRIAGSCAGAYHGPGVDPGVGGSESIRVSWHLSADAPVFDLRVSSGDSQSARAGHQFGHHLVVQVRMPSGEPQVGGQPWAGVPVTFKIEKKGVLRYPGLSTKHRTFGGLYTGRSGKARVPIIAGQRPGHYIVTARAEGAGHTVRFHLTVKRK